MSKDVFIPLNGQKRKYKHELLKITKWSIAMWCIFYFGFPTKRQLNDNPDNSKIYMYV